MRTRFAKGFDGRRNVTKPGLGRTPDAVKRLALRGVERAAPMLLMLRLVRRFEQPHRGAPAGPAGNPNGATL